MSPVFLNAMGVVCAAGRGNAALREAIFATAPSGIAESDQYTPGHPLHIGRIPGDLPSLVHAPTVQQTRNNAVLAAALADIREPALAAIERHGPTRVAIVLGVSTSGLQEGEQAARHHARTGTWPAHFDFAQQEIGSAAAFLARELGTSGPAHVISTACSSGAKAMASGARLLRAGLADAVIAGGVDALCSFTIAGFSALESVSAARCNPMSKHRNGINIGEGSALFLMSREPGAVRLSGWGENSDAHHMSAPDPSARGAIAAMQQALQRADLSPQDVDYVNLHGTATPHNDAMESRAVAEVLGLDTPVSSTKPLTGHALAAAGALEAAIAWNTLVDNPNGGLPVHWWDGERDPALPHLRLVASGDRVGHRIGHVMSNSFAFGGSNATLLFSRG